MSFLDDVLAVKRAEIAALRIAARSESRPAFEREASPKGDERCIPPGLLRSGARIFPILGPFDSSPAGRIARGPRPGCRALGAAADFHHGLPDPPPRARVVDGSFGRGLKLPGLSIIAEIKRRSPSKGDLTLSLDALETARAYARGGAAAISCLSDRTFFGARSEDFNQVRMAGLPVLRKDFIIDEIQIDESVRMGASAILLIARILSPGRLEALLSHATRCGLDVLVEVHDEAEIDTALEASASIIGVNNRDLATLNVDPDLSYRLRPRIPPGVVSVAESGIRTRDDLRRIEDAGFDAALIGETLVKSSDPSATLMELTGRGAEQAS